MIKLNKSDAAPADALITRIVGDDAYYYFAGDPEVIEMESENERQRMRFARDKLKTDRRIALQLSIVTVSGVDYQADETSQQRMARAVLVLNPGEQIDWTLADNTVAKVTREELQEALRLAVLKQTELWALDPPAPAPASAPRG